jgi:cation:H+ antiporter
MFFKHQTLVLNIPLLFIGFFLLNRGAGMLIDGASSIARKLKIPESAIGFTIVAFGTTLPKIFTNIIAAMNGYNDLLVGNIIGSNIVNLLGIVSLVGFSRVIRINRYTLFIGIPFSIFSIFIVYVLCNNYFHFLNYDKQYILSFNDGIIMLFVFVIFMTYGYFNTKKNHNIWFKDDVSEIGYYNLFFSIVLFVVGVLALYAGAILCVDNLIDISRKYNISERFLGQFILSVGGSIVMFWWTKNFKQNQSRFEFSTLIGTNILYVLAVLGVCALIMPIIFNPAFNLDLLLVVITNLLFMFLFLLGRKFSLNKWKCQFLFVLFLVYIAYLFLR